jgi:hypothetical protein
VFENAREQAAAETLNREGLEVRENSLFVPDKPTEYSSQFSVISL